MHMVILFLSLVGIIVFSFFQHKNSNNSKIVKNVVNSLLTFILFFVVYYLVICIVSMVPLNMLSSNSGADSGLWVYSIILGVVIAPILSLITTIQLTKKRKDTEKLEPIDDSSIIQKNKMNPSLTMAIIIVFILFIGIVLFAIFNLNVLTISNDDFYNIIYYDELEPGSSHDIKIYSDKIEIMSTHFCTAVDCKPTTKKEIYKYSKDEIKK